MFNRRRVDLAEAELRLAERIGDDLKRSRKLFMLVVRILLSEDALEKARCSRLRTAGVAVYNRTLVFGLRMLSSADSRKYLLKNLQHAVFQNERSKFNLSDATGTPLHKLVASIEGAGFLDANLEQEWVQSEKKHRSFSWLLLEFAKIFEDPEAPVVAKDTFDRIWGTLSPASSLKLRALFLRVIKCVADKFDEAEECLTIHLNKGDDPAIFALT